MGCRRERLPHSEAQGSWASPGLPGRCGEHFSPGGGQDAFCQQSDQELLHASRSQVSLFVLFPEPLGAVAGTDLPP